MVLDSKPVLRLVSLLDLMEEVRGMRNVTIGSLNYVPPKR